VGERELAATKASLSLSLTHTHTDYCLSVGKLPLLLLRRVVGGIGGLHTLLPVLKVVRAGVATHTRARAILRQRISISFAFAQSWIV